MLKYILFSLVASESKTHDIRGSDLINAQREQEIHDVPIPEGGQGITLRADVARTMELLTVYDTLLKELMEGAVHHQSIEILEIAQELAGHRVSFDFPNFRPYYDNDLHVSVHRHHEVLRAGSVIRAGGSGDVRSDVTERNILNEYIKNYIEKATEKTKKVLQKLLNGADSVDTVKNERIAKKLELLQSFQDFVPNATGRVFQALIAVFYVQPAINMASIWAELQRRDPTFLERQVADPIVIGGVVAYTSIGIALGNLLYNHAYEALTNGANNLRGQLREGDESSISSRILGWVMNLRERYSNN